MKREQLSDIIGNIDDRQVAEAFSYDPAHSGRSAERIVPMKKKRIITLALAAALILALGVGAYASINSRRVQDLVLKPADTAGQTDDIITIVGEDDADIVIIGEEEPLPAEPESESYDPLPGDVDMISLQGFAGSPEYQAALAWAEFEHSYDRDGSILASVGNAPTPWDEKYNYNGYDVYSQEMADKIDEIVAEYGLALHSGGINPADMGELYERFGRFCTTSRYSGYFYSDGTFQCDCSFRDVDFQLRRCMKGVLDTVYLNITDAESYEQWEYETACGETVLLALGPTKALILSETEQSFTVVNVLSGTAGGLFGGSISAAELEELADSIDFSIL